MPLIPTEPRAWLRRWGAIGGAIGIVAVLFPKPIDDWSTRGFDLSWPWERISASRGFLEVASVIWRLVLALLLLMVPRLATVRVAGLILLVASSIWSAVWFGLGPSVSRALLLAMFTAAAVVAAGNHLRWVFPHARLGRWLAGLAGCVLLAILAHQVIEYADPARVRERQVKTWILLVGIALFGAMGALGLASATTRIVRLGRMLARWGLALWVPFMFTSFAMDWLGPPDTHSALTL
jgi:hypothetical protein